MTIDLASVEAIDVHVHAEVGRAGEDGMRPEWRAAAGAYFGEHSLPTADEVITPDRWLADFAEADFKDEVRPLILKENAAPMLGL